MKLVCLTVFINIDRNKIPLILEPAEVMKSAKAFRAGCLNEENSPAYFCVTPNLIELLSIYNEMFPEEYLNINEG